MPMEDLVIELKVAKMSLSIPWLILFLLPISMEATTVPTNRTAITPKTMLTAENTTKIGCQRECGNLTIPYPFGIGPECALDAWFIVKCENTTYNPPKAFLETPLDLKDREILDITETEVVIQNRITYKCYESQTNNMINQSFGNLTITGPPFTISHSANKLTVIGCNDYALIGVHRETSSVYKAGCIAVCQNLDELIPGSCSGLGCCQASVPEGLQEFKVALFRLENPHNKTISELQPCSYAFFAREESYRFGGAPDLMTSQDNVIKRTTQQVPVVLDWALERQTSCAEAKNATTYLCQSNSECIDSDEGGYRCSCLSGYEGNPYLESGCTDIDECAAYSPCSMNCTNTPGGYKCSCPKGYSGDGFVSGDACKRIPDGNKPITGEENMINREIILGLLASLGTILLLLAIWWLCLVFKKRKIIQQKAKNFERNGGMLLQRQRSSDHLMERIKIFTADELDRATDHFNKDRILGEGGHGTVYKGMLSEGRLVAIKKSNKVDETEVNQFINEMVILSQINHRNIVKLLGCCLETEVPLLVYEFILNGTLFDHIHHPSEEFPITWKMRLQIAYETAGALDYLHTLSNIPIFHRDIKSSNILLDDKYKVKLSDFGTSRMVAINQTHITTFVEGSFGYLDPQYVQTSQFTQKSDVYSFGVVLVELLTRQKAIRTTATEDRSLISWFLFHMKNSCFMDIIDSQVLQEGSKEEFFSIANLAVHCLNLDIEKRPTMKDVQREIEVVRSLHLPQKTEQNWLKSQEVWAETAEHGVFTSGSEDSPNSSGELPLLFNPR